MKPIRIQTCDFVNASDLTRGINSDTIEAVSETLGSGIDAISWGNNNRTMVDIYTYRTAVENSEIHPNSVRAFLKRLDMIGDVYIDLEN